MRISSVFAYYGGKSKIIDRYPAPTHELIVEPFAGAAAYAWRYHDRDVWVNDLDPRTFSIWDFLTSPGAEEFVREFIPVDIAVGTRVSDLVPDWAPLGLLELMRAGANCGTQGAKGVRDSVTLMATRGWPRIRPKLLEVIPAIRHWKVTNLSYIEIDNVKATWFIDPPYANVAGDQYRQGSSAIDFTHLGDWCQDRLGQVIVCENAGANWLPFTPFSHRRLSIRSRYQKANAQEVVYVQNG